MWRRTREGNLYVYFGHKMIFPYFHGDSTRQHYTSSRLTPTVVSTPIVSFLPSLRGIKCFFFARTMFSLCRFHVVDPLKAHLDRTLNSLALYVRLLLSAFLRIPLNFPNWKRVAAPLTSGSKHVTRESPFVSHKVLTLFPTSLITSDVRSRLLRSQSSARARRVEILQILMRMLYYGYIGGPIFLSFPLSFFRSFRCRAVNANCRRLS